MGYCTYYSLYVKGIPSKKRFDELNTELIARGLYDGFLYIRDDYTDPKQTVCYESSESVKWYEHESDMISISMQFPEMTFMLVGDGDDYDDFWKAYFKNGTWELCYGEITYPEPTKVEW